MIMGRVRQREHERTLAAWIIATLSNTCSPPGRLEEALTVKELLGEKRTARERRQNPTTKEVAAEQRELARQFPDMFPQWVDHDGETPKE